MHMWTLKWSDLDWLHWYHFFYWTIVDRHFVMHSQWNFMNIYKCSMSWTHIRTYQAIDILVMRKDTIQRHFEGKILNMGLQIEYHSKLNTLVPLEHSSLSTLQSAAVQPLRHRHCPSRLRRSNKPFPAKGPVTLRNNFNLGLGFIMQVLSMGCDGEFIPWLYV